MLDINYICDTDIENKKEVTLFHHETILNETSQGLSIYMGENKFFTAENN